MKAMPRSEGSSLSIADIASNPPAEDPTATIGKEFLFFFLAVVLDFVFVAARVLFSEETEDFFLIIFFRVSLFLDNTMSLVISEIYFNSSNRRTNFDLGGRLSFFSANLVNTASSCVMSSVRSHFFI